MASSKRRQGKAPHLRRGELPAGPRRHSQRPPECCRTHAAASGRRSSPTSGPAACWDCLTLDLADSLLGVAILMSFRSWRAVDGPVARQVGRSVLDNLVAAEEELASRHSCGQGCRRAI